MPPWRTVHGYGDFHDISRLSRRELAILDHWVEAGAPEGEPGEGTQPPHSPTAGSWASPTSSWPCPSRFRSRPMGPTTYRVFVMPIPLDRDVAVAAVEFRPGNRKVAHHARFYLDQTNEMRRRDESDALPGFSVWGGGEIIEARAGGVGAGTDSSQAAAERRGESSKKDPTSSCWCIIIARGSPRPTSRAWAFISARLRLPEDPARSHYRRRDRHPARCQAASDDTDSNGSR